MTTESDANWPPNTTTEEKRRIRDYEQWPDVTKSYHQQEEVLREKFGRRLDEAELAALTNINVTIQRSEITAEGGDYGTGSTRDYKDSYKKDKYLETRQESKSERFPKQLPSSKFDIDMKKNIPPSHSRSRSSSKRSSASTEKKSKVSRRSRSYSTSSGSSRSYSRSRSKSPKGRSHRRNGKSNRHDSEGSKKRYDSKRSRSRSPKSQRRSRSSSRGSRSRSR